LDPCPCDEGRGDPPEPFGRAGGGAGVLDGGGAGVEVVVWVGGGGGGGGDDGVHDPDTPATGPTDGSGIDETGVPAGTLTVNVNVFPPTNVTVTVH
jgi:hypothetical protein